MNYTKGKWDTKPHGYGNWAVFNKEDDAIALTFTKANANLIAAAPLMHQELEETRAMFARVEAVRKLKGYEQTRYTRIKQALAKAESK